MPLEQFHGEVEPPFVPAGIEDVDDVRVLQPGESHGFLLEPGDQIGGVGAVEGNGLEGDNSFELQLFRFENNAARPGSQNRYDLVAGDVFETESVRMVFVQGGGNDGAAFDGAGRIELVIPVRLGRFQVA